MSKLTRCGMFALMLVLLAGLGAPGLMGQDDSPELEEDFEPNPEDDITVDFVLKDIHTVMHYIGLRSGLDISVDGEVDVKLTVMYRKVKPMAAIATICKTNKLDLIEDGTFIIIKQRQQTARLANVVEADRPGRYNVNFEQQPLTAAIMEVASVTKTEVGIPSVVQIESSEGAVDPDTEQEIEQRVRRIQQREVSLYMRDATPDQILERLRILGDLLLERREEGEGYYFSFSPYDTGAEGPTGPGGARINPEDITSRMWIVPEGDANQIKGEISNLLTPNWGHVVVNDDTDLVVVYDVPEVLDKVETFMTPLVERSTELAEKNALMALGPNFVAREYRVLRDIAGDGQEIVGQVQEVLSENGRIIPNPDRNSLIVYEDEKNIDAVDRIMAMLDTAPEQVLITAKLLEVTLDEYMGYGLEIFTSHSANNLNDGTFTGSSFDTPQGAVGGLFGQPTGFDPFFGTFSNPRVDVRLELLANEGRVETLSQPTQMVSNKQTARIEVGQEVPYLEAQSTSGIATTATVAFKEVSITMEVTPTVLENGLIRLGVIVTVREVIGNVAIEGNNTPIISKRESRTDVFIRDGETLIMGGMMRERERLDENGLPFLKDIPFLGYLFKSANRTTSKTDLLFFLRPQIVDARKGPANHRSGTALERDLRPVVIDDDDADRARIRNGRYRKLDVKEKPSWYNERIRPKKPGDVKPGA